MSTAVIDYMYGDKVGPYYGYPPRSQNQVRPLLFLVYFKRALPGNSPGLRRDGGWKGRPRPAFGVRRREAPKCRLRTLILGYTSIIFTYCHWRK